MKSALINVLKVFACYGVAMAMLSTHLDSAHAQNPLGNTVIDILPVSVDTGAGVINGDTVELTSGGVVVEFEFRVSNWGATGDGLIQSIQTTVDGNSYCSGLGDSLYPVGYPGSPVLSCPQGSGCPADGITCDQGGFIVTKRCTENFVATGRGARCNIQSDCPNEFCVDNPDYVFTGFSPLAPIAYPGLSYELAGVSQAGGKVDATCVGGGIGRDGLPCGPQGDCGTGTCTGPPVSAYFATLLVVVPPGAKGTYTIDITNDTERTFSGDGGAASFAIIDANSHPAFIVIPCTPNNLTCEDCNACTNDTLNPDMTCSNVPNFTGGVECCNPSNGTITMIDDGNECTRDQCNPTTGVVTHSINSGAPCGIPPVDECDAQDTCNFSGVCVEKFAFLGVPCGDPSTTACSNPDSCDGFGLCRSNDLSKGTACDDGLFCTVGETCAAGICIGAARDCSDAIPCTTDSCDEALQTCINDEVSCVCTTMVNSTPSSCASDARIPHQRTQSTSLLGWDSIDLDFNIGCTCDSLSIADLSISDVPGLPDRNDVSGQAVITGVTGGTGNLCTIEFAAPIPTDQWTCVTLKFNGEQRCIGALPSDIDGDQFATTLDITTLTTLLNNSMGSFAETDINRDGGATTLDLIESINLLIGADQFAVWLDANISQTCP